MGNQFSWQLIFLPYLRTRRCKIYVWFFFFSSLTHAFSLLLLLQTEKWSELDKLCKDQEVKFVNCVNGMYFPVYNSPCIGPFFMVFFVTT